MEKPSRVSEAREHFKKMEERSEASREYISNMQNGQVDELIAESPYLEKYKDALYQIRSSDGWMDGETVPLIAAEGEVLISMDRFDGAMGWNTAQYKIISNADRADIQDLSKVNQLPEYAQGFHVEDVAPVSENEVQKRIAEKLYEKLAIETRGFQDWPLEQKKALLEKYDLA